MGLVELMSLSDTANEMMEGKENVVSTGNTYEFTLAGSADEVTPALIKGDLDMACVPPTWPPCCTARPTVPWRCWR